MTAPLLLVHDDIAAIAAIRRLLSRAGYEVALASSVSDALTAFGHFRPALVILSPTIEGGSGKTFLDELAQFPEGHFAPVLLLGEAVEGSSFPVLPLPINGQALLESVAGLLTAPPANDEDPTLAGSPLPSAAAEPAPPAPPEPVAQQSSLAETLFGDMPGEPEPSQPPEPSPEPVSATLEIDQTQLLARPDSFDQLDPEPERFPEPTPTEALTSDAPEPTLARAVPLDRYDNERKAHLAIAELAQGKAEEQRAAQQEAQQRAEALEERRRRADRAAAQALEAMAAQGEGSSEPLEAAPEPEPAETSPIEAPEEDARSNEQGAIHRLSLLTTEERQWLDQELSRAKAGPEPEPVAKQGPPLGRSSRPRPPADQVVDSGHGGDPLPLSERLDAAEGSDYFAILGVARSAGRDEVHQAYERLSEQFHPGRFWKADAELRRKAERLSQLLGEAALALDDDRLRAQYAQSLVD